jgi:hypothetical protein
MGGAAVLALDRSWRHRLAMTPEGPAAPERLPGTSPRPPRRRQSAEDQRRGLPPYAPWVALASVIVIGAMPFVACPRLQDARAERRAEEALGALSACLGSSDPAELRGRAITAQTGDEDWPEPCGRAAASIEVSLTSLAQRLPPGCAGRCCDDDANCIQVVQARLALAKLRGALSSGRFDDDPWAKLVDAVGALGLEPEPAEAAADLPAPSRPPRPSEQTALAKGGYDASALTLADGGGWRLLLHARHKHASLCAIDPDEATASCRSLPPSIPIADSVLLVDGAPNAPLHVLARQSDDVAPERWGVYDAASGEQRLELEHDPIGVALSAGGEVAAIVQDGERVMAVSAAGAPRRLTPPGGASRRLGPPLVFGDWLFWPSDDPQTGVTLHAQRMTFTAGRFAVLPPISASTMAGWHPAAMRLQGCRADTLTVVVGVGEPAGEHAEAMVTMFDGRRWSSARVSLPTPWFGLACGAGAAMLTTVEERQADDQEDGTVRGHYVVSQQRCTVQGCTPSRAVIPLARRRRASRYLVGSVGAAVALAWRSHLGDVRMMVGPPLELATARARSALEGDEHGGYAWDTHGAEFVGGGERGLLLVASESSGTLTTHGLLVGSDGGVRPLSVSR